MNICWLQLYSSAPVCALGVVVKHDVPVDGAAAAVLA